MTMDPKLSMHQCGFGKNLSAQNCLLVMLEKWRKCLGDPLVLGLGITGLILTDLSKAFYCLIHDLLIAKMSHRGVTVGCRRVLATRASHSKKSIKNYV